MVEIDSRGLVGLLQATKARNIWDATYVAAVYRSLLDT